MRMIKLTGLPNPDFNDGKSSPVFVDPSRVVYVERSQTSFPKARQQESYRQARQCLFEEVTRVADEMKRIKFDHDRPDELNKWLQIRDIGNALQVAYSMTGSTPGEFFHPIISCTTMGIAYGGSNDKLAHFHVMETPEEVAQIIGSTKY